MSIDLIADHNPGEEVLHPLADVAMKKMEEFTSQNVSNAVMSFAKLEYHPGKEFMHVMSERIIATIATFTAQVTVPRHQQHYRDSLLTAGKKHIPKKTATTTACCDSRLCLLACQ